jgi:zinc/manganese transport system substrate-binding protein
MNISYRFLAVPILILALAHGVSQAGDKLKVVATTPDYAALALAIGGDEITIKTLAKPTEDPHFVDARPSHIVTLNRADMLIESGADLELGWLPPLIKGSRNKRVLPGEDGRFLGADRVRLLDVPTVLDRAQGDIHAKGNPHFLMNPENAGIVAHHLAERFCKLDEDSCPVYQQNLVRFTERLEQQMLVWTERLAPFTGTQVVTYHNTWKYFTSRFGLGSGTFLEPKPGIPPSPPHLAKVIAKMKADNIRVILIEPFQSHKTADTVAGHTGGTVIEVSQFPGGLPETENDYFALIDAVVNAVANALSGAS